MNDDLTISGSIKNYKFTMFIAVLITSIFLITNAYSSINGNGIEQIYSEYGFYKESILEGEYYRLITGILLHVGVVHLGSNVISLLLFGSYIEKRIGTTKMVLLTLLSLVLIWIFKLILMNEVIGIGISGYTCFLMTFVFTMYYKDMDKSTRKMLFQLIVFTIIVTLLIPFISLSGHFSGLITGVIMGGLMRFITQVLMTPKEIK